jgi:hypothetical protein
MAAHALGPDLATYHWIVLSSSAGKDSQAIARPRRRAV